MPTGHSEPLPAVEEAPLPELRSSRTGRWSALVPMADHHFDFLYGLPVDERVGVRWRYSGMVPTRQQFLQNLELGVLAQLVAVERITARPVGHVQLYSADLNTGTASVAVAVSPEAQRTGIGVEVAYLFLTYVFETYSFRKLYLEMPEYNVPLIATALSDVMVEEGRLRDHTYFGGRYWDRCIFAVYRQRLAGRSLREIIGRRLAPSFGDGTV
jgi:RimJ/RimL family protein N-acetyltransferase